MGKKKKRKEKNITDSTPVSFTLWSRANSGFASSLLQTPQQNMSEKNHTQAQTFTINRVIKYALDKFSISINTESFLYQIKNVIRIGPPPENVWTVGKDILISPWYTGALSCLVTGNWRQFTSRLRVLSKWKWTYFHNNQNVDTTAMINTNMGTRCQLKKSVFIHLRLALKVWLLYCMNTKTFFDCQ